MATNFVPNGGCLIKVICIPDLLASGRIIQHGGKKRKSKTQIHFDENTRCLKEEKAVNAMLCYSREVFQIVSPTRRLETDPNTFVFLPSRNISIYF